MMLARLLIYSIVWGFRLLPAALCAGAMHSIGMHVGPFGPFQTASATAIAFAVVGAVAALPLAYLSWRHSKRLWSQLYAESQALHARIDAMNVEEARSAALAAISSSATVRTIPASGAAQQPPATRPEITDLFGQFERLTWVVPGTDRELYWLDCSLAISCQDIPNQIRVGGFGGAKGWVMVHRASGRVSLALIKKGSAPTEAADFGASPSDETYATLWHFIVSITATIENGLAKARSNQAESSTASI